MPFTCESSSSIEACESCRARYLSSRYEQFPSSNSVTHSKLQHIRFDGTLALPERSNTDCTDCESCES